jgi:hypothetical protein
MHRYKLRRSGRENRWVRVWALEPTGGDLHVCGLREVDAVPVNMGGWVRACAGPGKPARGGEVVVVRSAASTAHAEARRGTEPCEVNSFHSQKSLDD